MLKGKFRLRIVIYALLTICTKTAILSLCVPPLENRFDTTISAE